MRILFSALVLFALAIPAQAFHGVVVQSSFGVGAAVMPSCPGVVAPGVNGGVPFQSPFMQMPYATGASFAPAFGTGYAGAGFAPSFGVGYGTSAVVVNRGFGFNRGFGVGYGGFNRGVVGVGGFGRGVAVGVGGFGGTSVIVNRGIFGRTVVRVHH